MHPAAVLLLLLLLPFSLPPFAIAFADTTPARPAATRAARRRDAGT